MDLGDLISEAYERAGILVLSGRDYRTARRSIDIMMQEWSNRGLNLWTVEAQTTALVAGTANYTLPSDTIDLIECMLRTGTSTQQQDYTLNRISVSTYATIPNKNLVGRPVQIYVDRQSTPNFTVWPTPDATQPALAGKIALPACFCAASSLSFRFVPGSSETPTVSVAPTRRRFLGFMP